MGSEVCCSVTYPRGEISVVPDASLAPLQKGSEVVEVIAWLVACVDMRHGEIVIRECGQSRSVGPMS